MRDTGVKGTCPPWGLGSLGLAANPAPAPGVCTAGRLSVGVTSAFQPCPQAVSPDSDIRLAQIQDTLNVTGPSLLSVTSEKLFLWQGE